MNDRVLGAVDSSIAHGVTLQFVYQNRLRVVCAYLLAKTHDDRFVCHGVQIAGETSKGALQKPEFRVFYLDQFESVPSASVLPFIPPALAKSETLPSYIKEVVTIYTELPHE